MNPVAAEAVHVLRGQAHVRADGNSALDYERDRGRHLIAALQLDHLRAGLQQPHRVFECLLRTDLIGAEWHVRDDEGALRATGDRAGVVGDVLDGHRQGRIVPLHHHAERIADQQRIDAGAVQHRSKGRVVAGQHRDLALGRGAAQIKQRQSHLRLPACVDRARKYDVSAVPIRTCRSSKAGSSKARAKRAREVMSSRWVDREALDLYSETTASGAPTLTPKQDRGSHGNGH